MLLSYISFINNCIYFIRLKAFLLILQQNNVYSKNNITKYYLENKMNNIFGIQSAQNRNRNKSAPYYEYVTDIIKKCQDIKDFPHVNSRIIYKAIKPDIKPTIETTFINYDWSDIWKNLSFRYISTGDRPVMYKYCHGTLTTKKVTSN